VQTGYRDTPPEYYSRLFEEHGMHHCVVYMDILSHLVFPDGILWSTWVIRVDMSDAMEKAAHMTLTTLCSQNLPITTGTSISLYPIQDRFDPEWRAHTDEASNFHQVHHHSGWVYMSHYSVHHCEEVVSSYWLYQGGREPYPRDQSYGPGEW
jgi:hypothetical protein